MCMLKIIVIQLAKKTTLDTIDDDLNTHGCDEFFTMRKLIMSKSMAYPLSEQFRATHSQLDSFEDSYEEPVATLLVLPRYWRLNHLYKCSKSQATQKDQSMARPWFKWGSNGRVAAAHSHISWNRLDVLAFLIAN